MVGSCPLQKVEDKGGSESTLAYYDRDCKQFYIKGPISIKSKVLFVFQHFLSEFFYKNVQTLT
jgi:hypothetical protein